MKKFSKLNNIKIPSESLVNLEESLESKIKKSLLSIMDRTLKIQSYGAVDNRFLSGSVKVDGKELLAEAIIDFFNDISNSKDIQLLESLKKEVKDWKAIDNKIEELKSNKKDYLNAFKIHRLIERYSSDKDLLKLVIKEKLKKSSDDYKSIIISELKKYNLSNILD